MVTEIMLGIFGYSVINLTSLKIMARYGYFEPYKVWDHTYGYNPNLKTGSPQLVRNYVEISRSPAVVSLLMPLHWLKLSVVGVFLCGCYAWRRGSKFLNALIRQDRHIYQARSQRLVAEKASTLKAIDVEVIDD